MASIFDLFKPACKCGFDLTIKKLRHCYTCGKYVDENRLWCNDCHFGGCKNSDHNLSCFRNSSPHQYRVEYVLDCEYCGIVKYLNKKTHCLQCGELLVEKELHDKTTKLSCPFCDNKSYLLLLESNIPQKFRNTSLQELDPNDFNDALWNHFILCLNSPRSLERWIVIEGPSGSQKTFLSCAFAIELILKKLSIRYVDLNDYLDDFQVYIYDKTAKGIAVREEHESIKRCRRLIITGVRKRDYKPNDKNRFFNLINYRSANDLPTLITTQLNPVEMAKAFGLDTVKMIIGKSGKWFKTAPKQKIFKLKLKKHKKKK